MDTRGLDVFGATSADAHRLVGGICLAAMEELGYRSQRLVVEVCPDPLGRPDVEASASAAGICVSPELLSNPIRLVWILSEEIAHVYLCEIHGVPNGGDFIDRFAQEMFASWFQTSRALAGGLVTVDQITATLLDESHHTPEFGGELGKHVGSAHGGSTGNVERLRDWSDRPGDEFLKEYVRGLRARLPTDGTPTDTALAIVREREDAPHCG